ncbi:MAG TPA: enoyl-CoA hydratase-related protein [Steroidobacteraceae bacterium]|nr:enoyl-CoA hydratase-related protein [Steroidobacteraceae bacterium]
MRILLLAHSFNSLTQRLWCELVERGHTLSLELDISDEVTREAVALHAPELVIAPFLKRAIPADVWRRVPCLIVHPGIPGDRGPAALDWAILEGHSRWGVSVLEASAEFDAGDVWASTSFSLRTASKASLYRDEVADGAVRAVLEAIERRAAGAAPTPLGALDPARAGRLHPPLTQRDRRIDWHADSTAVALAKLRAADSSPGVLDEILGVPCCLFDAHPAQAIAGAAPGAWLSRHRGVLLRATVDGAVAIGHARRAAEEAFKLPALAACPEAAVLPVATGVAPIEEIGYTEVAGVGLLSFEFYNGAMGTEQCERLAAALDLAARRPTRVLVLCGGRDFWSNGIHLNLIEAAASAADESWRNIQAIDAVAERIVRMDGKLTVAALRGNAGAGGAFLALAADHVWMRPGIVLNFHYRNMGNLYGSELWTYTLPRRIGDAAARRMLDERQPLLGRQAVAVGLGDAAFGRDADEFEREVRERAQALATSSTLAADLDAKRARRAADELRKPLARYRAEELERMRRSFYGFDTSYHVARHRFVHKAPHSWTPRHLARHRLVRAAT